MLLHAAPPAPFSPTRTLDDVRLAILRQHTQLEQLGDEVEARALAVIGGSEAATSAKGLGDALVLLQTHFVRHLDYEDANLATWLPSTAGAVDSSLLAAHEDQRATIRGLLHDRDVFGDPCSVAREALVFVHRLRKDIAHEETDLRAIDAPARCP